MWVLLVTMGLLLWESLFQVKALCLHCVLMQALALTLMSVSASGKTHGAALTLEKGMGNECMLGFVFVR